MILLWELFWTFFKISAFTFGGGYAMIPMMKVEIVSKGWMELGPLIDFIAVAESTPGPFSINLATFVGLQQGGVIGMICATAGVLLPSFIIILLIAKFFFGTFGKSKAVQRTLYGIRPAVMGLIAAAAVSVARAVLMPTWQSGLPTASMWASFNWRGLAILVIILAISRWKPKMHPIVLIFIAGCLGLAMFGLGAA